MYAFDLSLINLVRVITLIKFLIREITGDANADIWIAEDKDYIAELVTLPGIVPNRRNDRERSNSMYHSHDLNRRTE